MGTMVLDDPYLLVNSVDLSVRFANGTTYRGNNGLLTGPNSTSGGAANDRDTEECVIRPSTPRGLVAVTVSAPAVRADGHVAQRRPAGPRFER